MRNKFNFPPEVNKETYIVVHTVDDAVRQINDMVSNGMTTISMYYGPCTCSAYKNGDAWNILWQPPRTEKNEVPKEDVAREMGKILTNLLLD